MGDNLHPIEFTTCEGRKHFAWLAVTQDTLYLSTASYMCCLIPPPNVRFWLESMISVLHVLQMLDSCLVHSSSLYSISQNAETHSYNRGHCVSFALQFTPGLGHPLHCTFNSQWGCGNCITLLHANAVPLILTSQVVVCATVWSSSSANKKPTSSKVSMFASCAHHKINIKMGFNYPALHHSGRSTWEL